MGNWWEGSGILGELNCSLVQWMRYWWESSGIL